MVEGGGGCRRSHPGERGQPLRIKQGQGGTLNGMRVGQVRLQRCGLGSKVNSGTCPEVERVRAKWMPAVSRGGTGRLGEAWGKE